MAFVMIAGFQPWLASVLRTLPSTVETWPRTIQDRLGRPLRDLRLSVIDTCNFRCPYCMPESEYPEHHDFLPASRRLSFDQMVRLVQAFENLGVRKLRITGGEPLLRKHLVEFIARVRQETGIEDVALTTNGLLLERFAMPLRQAGLDRITLSLDSLDPDCFRRMTGGRGRLEQVLAGLDAAVEAGFRSLKINVMVQRGVNDDGVLRMVEHFRHSGHVLRFIEYMDVGTENRWRQSQVVPARELLQRIQRHWPLKPVEKRYHGEVANRYVFEDGAGEIGFITSISAPFCGDCTRARVSTDGKLYTCLFAQQGTDLRPWLDSGDGPGLERAIERVWSDRGDRYSELREAARSRAQGKKIEMYQIGG